MSSSSGMKWNRFLDGTSNIGKGIRWDLPADELENMYDNLGNRIDNTTTDTSSNAIMGTTGTGTNTTGTSNASASASINYSGQYASPETAAYLAKYEQNRPTYTQSKDVTDAWNKVTELEGQKPDDYVSKYGDQIQTILDQILNRKNFEYDFNADPMYQMYKDRYIQQGQMAMQDTLGDAAALTGGYGNSYATTAGNQAYQSYLQGLNDIIPDLREEAYNEWLNEGDRLNSNLSILQGLDDTDYGRYRDKVSDYKDDLNYYYSKYGDMSDREYNRYLNDADAWESDRAYWYNKWQYETDFNYQAALAAAAAAAAAAGSGSGSGGSPKKDKGEEETEEDNVKTKKYYTGSTYSSTGTKKTGSILAGAGPKVQIDAPQADNLVAIQKARDAASYDIWSIIAAAGTKGANAAQEAYDAAVDSGLLLGNEEDKATISYIRRWSR